MKLALRHGVEVLYHCTLVDEEALDLLEAQRERVFVAPTLGNLHATLHEAHRFGVHFALAHKQALEDELAIGIENMQRLKRRGVRVLPGGDYGVAWAPIGANARDIEFFVTHLGFTPMEAIVAATASGARIMRLGDRLGTVREGCIADLVLIDGMPLEDVTVLQNSERITLVMKAGRRSSADVWK